MSKQVWKGSALVAPVPPALVSCGTLEAPNVLTVAWTGMLQSQPPKTYISVRPERYSHGLITESREFVINLPTAALVRHRLLRRPKRAGRKQIRSHAPYCACRFAGFLPVGGRKPREPGMPRDRHCKAGRLP